MESELVLGAKQWESVKLEVEEVEGQRTGEKAWRKRPYKAVQKGRIWQGKLSRGKMGTSNLVLLLLKNLRETSVVKCIKYFGVGKKGGLQFWLYFIDAIGVWCSQHKRN